MSYPKIYQLETTNYCNARCPWCPYETMTRPKGFIKRDTVSSVINYMKEIGQTYIALHNMGEPLLHPRINEIIEDFKIAGIETEFSTNGYFLASYGELVLIRGLGTLRIAVDYFYNEPGYIESIKEFLEQSKKYDTIIRIHTIQGNDLNVFDGYGAILENKSFDNWAGKVDGISTLEKGNECYFLKYNYIVVLWDGRIVPCCMDYDANHIIGDINNIIDIKNKEIALCKNCAQMQFANGGKWKEEI